MSEGNDWIWVYWNGFGGRSGNALWLKRRFSVACEISQTTKIEPRGYNSDRMSKDIVDTSIHILYRKVMIGFGCIGKGLAVAQVTLYGSKGDSRWLAKFRKLPKLSLGVTIATE